MALETPFCSVGLPHFKISQACLVTSRRMVCTASQLESKHSGNGGGRHRDYGNCMEHQCGEGDQAKNAGEGEIFPKSIVRIPYFLQVKCVYTDVGLS